MNALAAVFVTQNLYRVDLYGTFVAHGVDPMMSPKLEGRAVAMVTKAELQAMHQEISEVLAGRRAPKTVTVEEINPEDLA